VSNYKECAEGLKKVEADLGPIDILVNNAGITRDAAFHKMTPEQWYELINTNLNSLFNMTRPVIEGMRNRGFGRIVNISSINGPERPVRPGELLRRESGRHRLYQGDCAGERRQGNYGKRHLPRLYRDRNGEGGAERGAGKVDPAAHSSAPARRAGGNRTMRGFPRRR
jgi:NAD(P)-dependent dehydrogenase (short-subunit alcohol dehydrogenase family)